jgi:hypothetical protein
LGGGAERKVDLIGRLVVGPIVLVNAMLSFGSWTLMMVKVVARVIHKTTFTRLNIKPRLLSMAKSFVFIRALTLQRKQNYPAIANSSFCHCELT